MCVVVGATLATLATALLLTILVVSSRSLPPA
jgi:hypothetical protein